MESLLIKAADYLVYQLIGLAPESTFGSALHYFLVGTTHIILLVIIITYIMGIVQSYLPLNKIRAYLEKNKKFGIGNLLASSLGAVTPFCSCSSIPLFVGMMQSRIPLGIALSFLITSPLVNEVAIAMFIVSYGWKFTIIYVLFGILLGVVGGIILDKIGMAKYVADWVKNLAETHAVEDNDERSFGERLPEIHAETVQTLKKLIPYILVGLAIGSFIHGFVPQSFFEKYINADNPFAVPIAVLTAIPLYIDAVGILPVIDSLIAKGVPMGTAIAFMMGAVGLSLPEALLLKKVMKKQLIITFFSTIGLGMILAGYFFNIMFS
ncbi:permease [Flammeovirga agarivorans]|uniref:Permease n=1 Tax=Flammeovirga agarivorans TaxID=2726742 RepID=A0A7X8XV25_9BACT|nr:permease [Flammeovirga agarivorans]NLR90814.1 permease [Flammeovirga agarivorans]